MGPFPWTRKLATSSNNLSFGEEIIKICILDEYTLIEAQLGVNWVGEWVVEMLLGFMYFGLEQSSDEKLCIRKLNGAFLTTIVQHFIVK